MSEAKFLPGDRLVEFLGSVPGDRKLVNTSSEEGPVWGELSEAEPAEVAAGLRAARPFYSFKNVLMPASELVARYGRADDDPLEEVSKLTVAVIGVRGCECRALAYLDKVMFDEPMADPFYAIRRENSFILAVDCAVAAESCFCNLLGEGPYPEANYDLNLSPIQDGFLVQAGSEKGQQLLADAGSPLSDATDAQLEERDAMRRKAAEQLSGQNTDYDFPDDFAAALAPTLEEMFWRTELSTCVQCGGCTAVCPTCYCFLLFDQATGEGAYERGRVWDSCQFTGYSEMAAAPGLAKPDPRREHMSKFQHRFAHKFWYSPLTLGLLGCVGCGRCSETCPGAIDLRRVLSQANKAYAEDA